ncbi:MULTISPECIES: CoA transferase [Methylobacterium]|uniref:Acetyl-CoA:oxalate CoA-transferase n=1 Tax=Methylobacterium bullatum TaxID=570505 RepID=A0AAV4Z8X4_9HYPH|nr:MULTISPECIES: CoA transferase [Methylobacterium]KQO54525.1 CoA-transferase [Methylobacterium sp. Leaf85]KQP07068.1 CoA-transferase [Methylobacterium sp. Leaf93]MBD8903209.1 CoA transferase [Methylobacterium bullatum]TXN27879.1 CoA transferase [Methylobacterium sp. WL19]GJD40381.1 Acetyl-CoA:oxalate CoA-transferase [Methylobacterium bullatum]
MDHSVHEEPRPLPLAGIRVLDVTQVMAGPFCSMLLGDLGADVIKVEPPGTGDQTRSAMGFKMKGPDSMGFLNMNRNKRSLALNLKSDAGRDLLLDMAANADVLVENYRPGVMARLGLGYEAMRARNPGLIYASISGFGQSGPWAKRPGYDLMAQAMSGVMSVTGHPGGPPVKAGVPVADIGCALFTVYAILSAYIGRQASGEGQYIDASLFDAALAFSIWDVSEYWGTGRIPQPLGTSNRMSAPYQAVRASDGYFVMGATNQKLWRLLCDVLDRAELFEDARFVDIPARLANREELIEELERSFAARTSEEWVSLLLAAGIPAGRMNTYPEAFESEHGRHRQMRIEVPHPIEGTVPNIGFPVKLTGTPQRARRHAPLLGEHTEDVLSEFGLSADEIEALRLRGAFAA